MRNVVFNELLFLRFKSALSNTEVSYNKESLYKSFYDLYILANPVFQFPISDDEYNDIKHPFNQNRMGKKKKQTRNFKTFKLNVIRDIVESDVRVFKYADNWNELISLNH